MDPHDIERRLLNKRSRDQSSSIPSFSKRPTNRDEVNDESSSKESSINSQSQERRQHKRQRTDEEDNSTTSITKRPPPMSHDHSTRSCGKEPAGGKRYKQKKILNSDTTSQIPTRSSIVSIYCLMIFVQITMYLLNIIIPLSILYVSGDPKIVLYHMLYMVIVICLYLIIYK